MMFTFGIIPLCYQLHQLEQISKYYIVFSAGVDSMQENSSHSTRQREK